ncbi:MAG: replication initiator protein A [Clostridiales bacterium]|nr:replication initiator protein A [Clostridiales bacterium]
MGGTIRFDYYYGIEAEQFSFYRVPRLLIKDERFKGLSSDAKLLYGLMLDRMSLSMKNGWLDDENRAYIIYTIDAIMEDLGCGKDKAIKVLAELDTKKGIGLVERIRRGLGKPDIIYVKNFVISKDSGGDIDSREADDVFLPEVGETDLQKSEKPTSRNMESRLQEVEKTDFSNSDNQTLESMKTRLQEVGKPAPNYTNISYNNQNYTDMSYTNPINPSENKEQEKKRIDMTDEVNSYIALIKENIEYEHHMKYAERGEKGLYEELFSIICDVVCVKRETISINGEDYPYELVKSRFLKLTGSHLEYVIGCMRKTTTRIANIRAYMITALYNAPMTINHFYQQEVQHDMYGGGWAEQGIT